MHLKGNVIKLLFYLTISLSGASLYALEKEIPEEVIVVHPEHFPPYYITDEKGKPSGFAIELIKELAIRSDLKLRFITTDWPSSLELLEAGDAHVIPSLGITERRNKNIKFMRPTDSFNISIFVLEENKALLSKEELKDLQIGVRERNAANEALQNIEGVDIVVFSTFSDMLEALVEKKIDAFAYPEPVVWYNLKKRKLQSKVVKIGKPLREIKRSVAVSKDQSKLHKLLEGSLEAYLETEDFTRLSNKWLSSDLPKKEGNRALTSTGVLMLMLTLLTVFFVLYFSGNNAKSKYDKAAFQDEKDKRFILIIGIMTLVAVSVMAVVIGILYHSSFKEVEARLQEDASNQAKLIDRIGKYNLSIGNISQKQAFLKTTVEVKEGLSSHRGRAEITIGRRYGDNMEFLLRQKSTHQYEAFTIPFSSPLAEPMRLALSGKSGTLIGIDYKNSKVLAAYQDIPIFDMGVVVKVGINEIREPFVFAAIASGSIAFLIILVGGIATHLISTRIMKEIEDGRRRFKGIFENSEVTIWEEDMSGVFTFFEALHQQGIVNIEQYLANESGRILEVMSQITISSINSAGLKLFSASTTSELKAHIQNSMAKDPSFLTDKLFSLWYKKMCFRQEVSFVTLGGERIVGTLSFQCPRYEADFRSISISLVDITERKKAEQKIAKLAQAVEQSPESIIITSVDGCIEYVNETFTRNTGYEKEEVIGKNPRILHSGNTPKETYTDMWDTLNQEVCWKGVFFNQRKDGSEYTEFAIVSPIRQEGGEVTHYLAVKEDVTEKIKMEDELNTYRSQLEELVNKRTKDLIRATKIADIANRAKSAFLANISHEIRTPMNAILGLTHLLQRSNPSAEQSKKLEKIDSSGGHLLAIINDVLDLSKIEAGKIELEYSNFHLDALYDQIQSMVRDEVNSKDLCIEFDNQNSPLWLRGDEMRVRQALLNYVANAIKFTESGKIIVSCKQISDDSSGLLLRFEVRDTGIGIEASKISELFRSFEQADVSTTRKFGGTGLGLAITKQIALLMGGDAGAESTVGLGSCFWFTGKFERGYGTPQRTPLETIANDEPELTKHYTGARILLVEDNEINADVASELLSSVGLAVDIAVNGKEAIEMVRNNYFDLVLMDIQMPIMGGIEATKNIRKIFSHETLPIIAMSANIYNEEGKACKKAGMNDFIAKPVVPSLLFSTLLKWLRKSTGSAMESQASFHLSSNVSIGNFGKAEKMKLIESISGLDVEAGLQNMLGDVDRYIEMLQRFDLAHNEDVSKLSKFLAYNKVDDAKFLLHKLKGVAGTIGLTKHQTSAENLEKWLNKSLETKQELDVKLLTDYLQKISEAQNSLHLSIIKVPDKSQNRTKADSAKMLSVLEGLRELVSSDDTKANKFYASFEDGLNDAFGDQAVDLGKYITAFDYQKALATIDAINANKALPK